jgi:nucleoside-diphosphate kinase
MSRSSFFLLKPDALRVGLDGLILTRVIYAGFRIERLEIMYPQADLFREHYRQHAEGSYFGRLIAFSCSGPVMAGIVARRDGGDAVALLRALVGPYAPPRVPGTIRGDLMPEDEADTMRNLIHSSDSASEAAREIELWFGRGLHDARQHEVEKCPTCGWALLDHDAGCSRHPFLSEAIARARERRQRWEAIHVAGNGDTEAITHANA